MTVWMDIVGIMLSEISQTEKEKHLMISLICGTNEQNKQRKQKQTHRYREPTEGCQREGGLEDWVKSEGVKNYNW